MGGREYLALTILFGTATEGFFIRTIKRRIIMEAGCKSGFCCAMAIVEKLAGVDGAFINDIIDNGGAGSLFEGAI